ncbi:MAG TPA: DUF4167 domain-containing protein [Methyloceanibacter sp.]|jgi:hypothetical protein
MRQGQQNRRGRGRGGRKPQNPLSRSFESNGPDVKIRGTAAHIAEKYTSLARDAMASGDLVASESYLQHAEHYNRIIMTAQQQFGPQGGQPGDAANGVGFRPRGEGDEEGGDDGEGDDFRGGPQYQGREQQGREPNQGREYQGREPYQGRESQQGRERQGGGGQDRERHTGDREHHGGGREQHGRRGANGAQPGNRDRDEQAQPEAGQQGDEPASDPAS